MPWGGFGMDVPPFPPMMNKPRPGNFYGSLKMPGGNGKPPGPGPMGGGGPKMLGRGGRGGRGGGRGGRPSPWNTPGDDRFNARNRNMNNFW